MTGSLNAPMVSFYADSNFLGNADVSAVDHDGGFSYTLTWLAVPKGQYSITAILTDDLNDSFTTSPITINVNIILNLPVFDNGLQQSANEVYVGGTLNNGLSWYLPPNEEYNDRYTPMITYGYLNYDNRFGYFSYDNYYPMSDTANIGAGFSFRPDAGNNFSFYTGYSSYSPSTGTNQSGYAEIDGSSMNGAGLSLTAVDDNSSWNNGIQIYSTGIDLNTPGIQLNYFPNTPAMDSVLVTDSLGNLHQKAMSSFGSSGHWQMNGTSYYDTLDANIGIGTVNPQSKLAVNGTITAQKVKVTQSGWADYVFDSTYLLRPLTDVVKYISAHKHLEGIPSFAEVNRNGIDLGNNQVALLKKIEELTLYVIDQEKRIKDLEDKVNNTAAVRNTFIKIKPGK